jgi:hypothetical protein
MAAVTAQLALPGLADTPDEDADQLNIFDCLAGVE